MSQSLSSKLRMVVVGVGSLGQHHANKLAMFEDVELVAVVDPSEQQGRAIAGKVATNWHPTIDTLPSEIDGVVIATPTVYHMDPATKFLSRGIATFVEKPLATNVADATALCELASQHDAILQVGHIERFNPAFTVTQERSGHPLYIRCQRVAPYTFRSTDIGVVHDLMIHDIDLALALTKEMPVSVDAFGAVGIGPHEDMAVARLKMPSGTVVDITASRMCPSAERTMQVWGTDGCVQADLQTRTVQHWRATGQFAVNPGLVHALAASTPDPRTLKDRVFSEWIQAEEVQAEATDAMQLELEDFKYAICNNSQPRVSGNEGVNAMTVAEQVLEALEIWSYQTGTRVSVEVKRHAA